MSDNTSAVSPARTPPKLTRGETWLVYLTVALLLAVGTLGLIASYQSVSERATVWGFQTPQLLPIAIDLAIPGFTIAHLLLIRMDMELAWVRAVPFGLTYVTIYLNIQAGTSTGARIAHGALPLIWVLCSEIAGHVYRVLIGAATGKRMERIRRARFLLAPLKTGAMWRRMILWEETSYGNALARERERVLAHADLRERYGRSWRVTAPIRERALLRLGEHAPMALQVTPAERPGGADESATMTPTVAPSNAIATPAQSATAAAPVAPPATLQSATHGAPVSLVKRHQSATATSNVAPQPTPPKRPITVTRNAPKAPRKAATKAPQGGVRSAARDAIEALYIELGRRPLESEMVAALIKAKLPKSRQFANARRLELEREKPALAALGSQNVRALTAP